MVENRAVVANDDLADGFPNPDQLVIMEDGIDLSHKRPIGDMVLGHLRRQVTAEAPRPAARLRVENDEQDQALLGLLEPHIRWNVIVVPFVKGVGLARLLGSLQNLVGRGLSLHVFKLSSGLML